MPSAAFQNRTKASFPSEMPMGQQHLGRFGKRFYSNEKPTSVIQNEHLLESPQRYPFENRIALDKSYSRNLNTIDIEGASGSSMTQGMKNRLKAREELLRRQKQSEGLNLGLYQPLEMTQEEKRRKVALDQFNRKMSIKDHGHEIEINNPNSKEQRITFSRNQQRHFQDRLKNRTNSLSLLRTLEPSKQNLKRSLISHEIPLNLNARSSQKIFQRPIATRSGNLMPTASQTQIHRAGRTLLNR